MRLPTGVRLPRGMTASGVSGGGPAANEELTAHTGVVLIVLLAVLGITILQIHQLIWLHLFLGFLLIGPVLLKTASTGYRFIRYYSHDPAYYEKGPPGMLLRFIGPGVVLSTITVFVSGTVLMFQDPARRQLPLLIHKASFIVWLGLTGLHVLGHLPGLGRSLRATQQDGPLEGLPVNQGATGRWIVLIGALLGGVVLAVVLIPHFSLWTAPGAFPDQGDH